MFRVEPKGYIELRWYVMGFRDIIYGAICNSRSCEDWCEFGNGRV